MKLTEKQISQYHTEKWLNRPSHYEGEERTEEVTMPYIKQEKRHVLDPHIAPLLNALRELESDDPENSMAGNLNYVISKLLNRVCNPPKYDAINECIGVLECCKLELYRRIAAGYEDIKVQENGDVYNIDV